MRTSFKRGDKAVKELNFYLPQPNKHDLPGG